MNIRVKKKLNGFPIFSLRQIHLKTFAVFHRMTFTYHIDLSTIDTSLVTAHTSMCGGRPYTVYKYNKEKMNDDLVSTIGLFRSLVVDQHGRAVAFAPPKSVPCDAFLRTHPICANVFAEEFVEGTMVNAFFDKDIEQWEIATRTTVGACSTFYQLPDDHTKTFREMFNEAARQCRLNLNDLNRDYCYSFVLRHPDNRIVVPVLAPTLCLTNVYQITQRGSQVAIEARNERLTPLVKTPDMYDFENYGELVDRFGSMNTPYTLMGVVLYDPATGERAKIRNPNYELVRELRGNQPKLQFQYLVLRKEGKVSEHLEYFPEHKRHFSKFRDQVHLFTDQLFANYVDCYIKKKQPLADYPAQYRTHMYTIHRHYLDKLVEEKGSITRAYVREYVNTLPTALLMHCLNYDANKSENNVTESHP